MKLDDEGVKRLATGISISAVTDLDLTYRKTMRLHKVCYKSGKCDKEQLINYLVKFAEKRNYVSLPFQECFEHSALDYFSNEWGNQLLDIAGISYLPKDFKDRLELLWSTYNKCRPCITRCIKDAELRVENERELTVAE